MNALRVILVTGLPGTGKSTLALAISAGFGLPVLAKDLIKEPLLDGIGIVDAASSRRLSDISFEVLFRLAREWKRAGQTALLLEGNFRAGEHERVLLEAIGPMDDAGAPVRLAQVLCRVPESERLARLEAREKVRHPGHRVGERAQAQASSSSASAPADAFLDLPSARFLHDGANTQTVLASLADWMNLREPSL